MSEPTQKFRVGDSALYMHWGALNDVKITYGSFGVRDNKWFYRLSFAGVGDGNSSFEWNTSLLVSEETLYKDIKDLLARHSEVPASTSPVKFTLTLEFPNV